MTKNKKQANFRYKKRYLSVKVVKLHQDVIINPLRISDLEVMDSRVEDTNNNTNLADSSEIKKPLHLKFMNRWLSTNTEL